MVDVLRVKKEFDANFYIPEGVEDIEYRDDDLTTEEEESLLEQYDDSLQDVPGDLEVPEDIVLVKQKIRIGGDGRLVVDVVFELEDIDENIKYDVRLSDAN